MANCNGPGYGAAQSSQSYPVNKSVPVHHRSLASQFDHRAEAAAAAAAGLQRIPLDSISGEPRQIRTGREWAGQVSMIGRTRLEQGKTTRTPMRARPCRAGDPPQRPAGPVTTARKHAISHADGESIHRSLSSLGTHPRLWLARNVAHHRLDYRIIVLTAGSLFCCFGPGADSNDLNSVCSPLIALTWVVYTSLRSVSSVSTVNRNRTNSPMSKQAILKLNSG